MTPLWLLWVGLVAGAVWAMWRDPRGREVLQWVELGLLNVAIAFLELFEPRTMRPPPRLPPPPTPPPPPRRTAGLTVEQTLRRLYVAENAISAASYETLLGRAMAAGILHRVLAPHADVDAVLDALDCPEPAMISPRRSDCARLDDPNETILEAEQRLGRCILDVVVVRAGLGTPLYRLVRLGGPLQREPRDPTNVDVG